MARYRTKGLIKPIGVGISSTKLSYFYHPRQIKEFKKKLGITLTNTSNLLSENQFIKESGLTGVARYRTKGLIKPVGVGIASASAGTSPFYHPRQIRELKKKLGITLTNTSGLLNEKQFIEKSGLTKVADYRTKGLIKPVGFGMVQSGLGRFYHPRQIKELRKKLGITLTNTSGLLSENQFMKKSGLKRVPKCRKQGLIRPVGFGITSASAGISPFYHPRQIRELKKKLGITLTNISGLLSENQFKKASGLTMVTRCRKQGLIKPVGVGMSATQVSFFYHPRQIKELRKKLGITLADTSDLLSETRFIRESGLTNVAKYRKQGLIKPVGVGIVSSGLGWFYHPRQIKELRKKLKQK